MNLASVPCNSNNARVQCEAIKGLFQMWSSSVAFVPERRPVRQAGCGGSTNGAGGALGPLLFRLLPWTPRLHLAAALPPPLILHLLS